MQGFPRQHLFAYDYEFVLKIINVPIIEKQSFSETHDSCIETCQKWIKCIIPI